MGGEWCELRVADLVHQGALAISDGYRVRNEELGSEGIPFVRGGDIGDGWINTKTIDHIKPEYSDRIQLKLTRPGDAAFITKGTVGRAGRLRQGQPPVVFAPQVAYWRVLDREVLDPGFVYGVRSDPRDQGKEAGFWHAISEGANELERTPDLRRCERVRWIRAIIEHADVQGVCVWEEMRGSDRRIHIALSDFSYLVVLADRRSYVQFITAFCVEHERQRQKKKDAWERAQKS